MNTIGQLSPALIPYSSSPSLNSEWRGVAASFSKTGDNIRKAIKESNAKSESKQKT